ALLLVRGSSLTRSAWPRAHGRREAPELRRVICSISPSYPDRAGEPTACEGGAAREPCRTPSDSLGVRDPMPPLFQQPGPVRPPQHEAGRLRSPVTQGASLPVRELAPLVPVQETFGTPQPARRRPCPRPTA